MMKKEIDPYQEYIKIKAETLVFQKRVEAKIQKSFPRFCLDTIPHDDPRTMRKIIDSSLHPIMRPYYDYTNRQFKMFLKRIKPDTINDLASAVAVYRPGPMASGMTDNFLKCKHICNDKSVYAVLLPIIKNTRGIILYQEQIMEIAKLIAGFSTAQANIFRKLLGRKEPDKMEQFQKTFIAGARRKHYSDSVAKKIFNCIAYHGSYVFNRHHAYEVAWIAYKTIYLKVHFPEEFKACS